jgi:hypothetical protein
MSKPIIFTNGLLLAFSFFLACCTDPTPGPPVVVNCPPGFSPCEQDSTLCCQVVCPPGYMVGGPDSSDCVPIECPPGYYLGGVDSSECIEDFSTTAIIGVEYYPSHYMIKWMSNPALTFSEYRLYKSPYIEMQNSELAWSSSIQSDTTVSFPYDSSCEKSYFQLHTYSNGGLDSVSIVLDVTGSSYTSMHILSGGEFFRSGTTINQLSDSSYIIMGDCGPDWPYSDIELLSMVGVTNLGEETFSRVVENWWWANMSSASVYDDNLIYIFNSGSDVGYPQGSEIHRADLMGDDIWSVANRVSMGFKLLHDHIVSNNTIIAVGEHTETEANIYYDMWATSYDLSGTELWSSRFQSPDTNHAFEAGYCLSELEDGYLVACGARVASNSSYDLVLFSISNNGDLSWSSVIQSDFRPFEIIKADIFDDLYMIVGESSSGIQVITVLGSGLLQMSEFLGSGHEPAISSSDDGNVLVTYNVSSVSFEVVNIGFLEGIHWRKTYSEPDFENTNVYDVIRTLDGGFALTGETETAERNTPIIIKLDCGGNLHTR